MAYDRAQQRRVGCLPIALSAVACVLVGTVIGIYGSDNKPPVDPVVAARERAEGAALFVGQRAVRERLKDPSSAVFSEGLGRTVDGQHVACGMVNAKNSFGAMAGKEPWLAIVERDIVMVRSPQNSSRFYKLWNHYCAGAADK